MTDKYKPATPGMRIPMPGNQPDWPQEGREINPLSGYENRLVADGDVVLVAEVDTKQNGKAAASPKAGDASNGGDN